MRKTVEIRKAITGRMNEVFAELLEVTLADPDKPRPPIRGFRQYEPDFTTVKERVKQIEEGMTMEDVKQCD